MGSSPCHVSSLILTEPSRCSQFERMWQVLYKLPGLGGVRPSPQMLRDTLGQRQGTKWAENAPGCRPGCFLGSCGLSLEGLFAAEQS